MDDMNREEVEKTCKKIHKVQARMVAVRMVCVCNISVSETAYIQGRCPNWVRNLLHRYDGGLEGLRDLPRCGRPRRILRNVMDEIIAKVVGCRITPMGLQQYIRVQTGTSLHITYVRKIMRLYNPSPKEEMGAGSSLVLSPLPVCGDDAETRNQRHYLSS